MEIEPISAGRRVLLWVVPTGILIIAVGVAAVWWTDRQKELEAQPETTPHVDP